MVFKTETGSTYEVDKANNRIRRVSGYTQHTKRFDPQGEWRPYKELGDVEVGACVVVWGDDVEPLVRGSNPAAKTTITSPVIEIVE